MGYWIACELAGVSCGFSPRGRPMHLFSHEVYRNAPSFGGCLAQVLPEAEGSKGDGSKLLYVDLESGCPSEKAALTGVTVWNQKYKAIVPSVADLALSTRSAVRKLDRKEL